MIIIINKLHLILQFVRSRLIAIVIRITFMRTQELIIAMHIFSMQRENAEIMKIAQSHTACDYHAKLMGVERKSLNADNYLS